MNTEITKFVEQAGLVFESEGMPRMAGRVLGYLMVCTPAEQSIAAMMEALQASNGSISTTTRFLESQGFLDRISVPGERKDYFALPPGVAATLLTSAQKSANTFTALFDRAITLTSKKGQQALPSLYEARDLFAFLAQEYPLLLERWQKNQRRPGRSRSEKREK
jgi:DNA-binding transcriptional regulator GbsR (MarR family)